MKAKQLKQKSVKLLGTGKPLREFLYVEDLANAVYLMMRQKKSKIKSVAKNKFPMFNVGTGRNISIKKLSELIKKKIKYNGKIHFDKSYPDGTMKKNLDSSKIKKFGWKPKIKLSQGLSEIIENI